MSRSVCAWQLQDMQKQAFHKLNTSITRPARCNDLISVQDGGKFACARRLCSSLELRQLFWTALWASCSGQP